VLGLLTVSAAEQKDTSEKVFHGAAGGRLTIENVIGSISVTAVAGHDVRVTMTRSIKGRGPDDIAQAQREVVLESGEDGGNVRFHVKFPSEDNCGKDGCADGRHDRQLHGQLRISRAGAAGMLLKLSTVTAGDINVHGAFGDFDVNNVNGGIEMSDILDRAKRIR